MLPFENNSVFLVSGQSQSGKSHWTHRLCRFSDVMFPTPVDKIIYCYKHFQKSFLALQKQVPHITFSPKIPTEEELSEATQDSAHALLIIDDAMEDILNDNPICQALATRLSHHLQCSVVFCTQSGQLPGKYGGLISKNVHNSIVMRSPKESFFLRTLGTQLGEFPLLKAAYSDSTGSSLHSYLAICLHPTRHPDLRYCGCVLPDDPGPTTIYKKPSSDQ